MSVFDVLVMGGTRFNGLALVHELVRAGHRVTVFNRGQTEAKLPREIVRVYGDRHDAAGMREAFAGKEFDCIHDTSGYTLEDAQTIVELFRGRTGHYIFASSVAIYGSSPQSLPVREGDPIDLAGLSEYARDKLSVERYLTREYRERGFAFTTVAFPMVFGPHNHHPDQEQRMYARMLRGRPVLIPGDGHTLGHVGHVDDQARALRMMMLNPVTYGKRYNVAGNKYFDDHSYIDTFAAVAGVEPERLQVPAAIMDELWDGPNRATMRNLVQRAGGRWDRHLVWDTTRLRTDLGWAPEYSFPAAVQQTYEWYLAEGRDRTQSFDFSFEDQLIERLRAAGVRAC